MDLWASLDRMRRSRLVVAAVMVPNLLGIVYGYYYYFEVGQFDPASPHFRSPGWWPLVADSPNAVLLCSVALLGTAFFGWRSKWLDAIAAALMVYVGLWTTTLFLLYPQEMGTFDWHEWPGNANPLLFVSHMGMPLEALLLVPALRKDAWPGREMALLVAGLFAFLAVDYSGPHLHPAPFLHPADQALHRASPWVMAATAASWLALVKGRGRAGRPQPASQDPM